MTNSISQILTCVIAAADGALRHLYNKDKECEVSERLIRLTPLSERLPTYNNVTFLGDIVQWNEEKPYLYCARARSISNQINCFVVVVPWQWRDEVILLHSFEQSLNIQRLLELREDLPTTKVFFATFNPNTSNLFLFPFPDAKAVVAPLHESSEAPRVLAELIEKMASD